MVEMHAIDTQSTARRFDDSLKSASLQVELVEGAVAGQEQVAAGADRVTRQDHIAELESPLAQPTVDHGMIDQHVAGRTESGKMGGKERREGFDKIHIVVSAVASRDLLKSDHVRVTDAVGDPIGVETPVLTETILDVVAHELHDTL
jgi:hypothetical protein